MLSARTRDLGSDGADTAATNHTENKDVGLKICSFWPTVVACLVPVLSWVLTVIARNMSAGTATDAGAGPGAGAGSMPAASASGVQRVVVPSLARLPTFCHATVHNGLVHVAGTLGTTGATLETIRLEEGVSAQTFKALENIETILVLMYAVAIVSCPGSASLLG